MFKKFSERYDQLEEEYPSKKPQDGTATDIAEFITWETQAKLLIEKTCGKDSVHYSEFISFEAFPSERYKKFCLKARLAVFLAAKSDYQGGYTVSIKSLVQADLFGSQLEQAKELLSSDYLVPAAVVAGIVLETALRELCIRKSIEQGKLDKMNADLVKADVYDKLQQKEVTYLAAIRNSAAHGKSEELTKEKVSKMIRDVGDFLLYLSE